MKPWPHLLACAGVWLASLHAVAAQGQGNSEVTTLSEINQLTTPSPKPRPFRVKGVVVCFDAGWHQLYLHDGAHTTYFNADDFQIQPETGQLVEITGVAQGSNVFANLKLTIRGKSALPNATPLKLTELDKERREWVETTGRVLSAENSRGRLALLIHDNRQNCLVFVLGAPV